jgi:Transcriptional regulators
MQSMPLGARLPPERVLAESFDCSFLTVRRALKALVEDGSVVRKVGSGTYVAKVSQVAQVPRVAPAPVEPERGQRKIGALVYRQGDAYAYRILQALSESAVTRGLNLRTAWVGGFGEEALEEARRMVVGGCEALVLPWFPHKEAEAVRMFVAHAPLPVCLPEPISGLERNSFVAPGRFGDQTLRATASLCVYLEALGCERVAYLGPAVLDDPILQKALSAFVAHRGHRGDALCGLVQPGAREMDRLAERWAEHHGGLGVVSYDDEHALRFMTAMHKRGLTAPHDFRIVGFNDTEASAFSDPPLSTVAQDFSGAGHWMIEHALALAVGESAQSPGTGPTGLIVRETCGGAGRIDDALRALVPDLQLIEVSPPAAAAEVRATG